MSGHTGKILFLTASHPPPPQLPLLDSFLKVEKNMLSILFENVTNILFKNKYFIYFPPFHCPVKYKPPKSRKLCPVCIPNT